MKQIRTQFLVLTLGLLLPALLAAQPPDHFPSGNRPGRGDGHGRWGKMATNMENLRFLKLLEALELNEEQSLKFVPLFHAFRQDTRELFKERREIVAHLEELINQTDVDDDILKTLDELEENDDRMEQRQERFFDECSAFFTVPQLARMAVFHERFERDILKALREFHRGGGPPGEFEKKENNRQGNK